MVLSSKISFFLFLLTVFTSHHIYARESQFFNKIPSNTNNVAVENQPKQEDPLNKPDQEPNFIPENENGGYGLYGHESGQLPPTTTTTTNTNLPYNNQPNNFLPKNYNTESYVTESEGYNPAYETKYTDQKQSYPAAAATTTVAVNGQYYDPNYDQNSYNAKQQGVNDFKLGQASYKSSVGNNYNYNYKSNGANINPVEKQGMSDTRFIENGKYFYDLNLEKNNRYPSQNTQGFGEQNSKNGGYYGSGYENFNSFSNDEFENQSEQFQDFQDLP